jgi:RNA polymerase sigma-70 factor (ECF subfamily)
MALLADNVQLLGDGGGVVPSFGKVLHGALRIANLYHVVTRQPASQPHYELATINGRLGLLRWMDGVLESAQSLDTDGERIHAIYVVRNPHKLRDIAAQRGHETRS